MEPEIQIVDTPSTEFVTALRRDIRNRRLAFLIYGMSMAWYIRADVPVLVGFFGIMAGWQWKGLQTPFRLWYMIRQAMNDHKPE